VVTVDLGERKDADLRNRFTVPKDLLLKHLCDVGFSHLTDQNSHEELKAFNAAAWDISLNVDFFKWLRGVTKLPILLKGVLSPDAAQQAVDLGLNGIVVSNHGGRRLDGMPASIDVLHEVAQAVDGKIEILMDGGVRRGGDVMKAVAFGAKAVLIGRPQAWALAAEGEAGVKRVLDILRDELTNAMIASGCATVDDVNASLLRV
jgi:isopentenyl diphosphate isomerase/L-lactate dehydrogenase-like FMN-dependent dehydrogenase